jgi:hypothetical protein
MKLEESNHDNWVQKLADWLTEYGYTVIREGRLSRIKRGWAEPDLFVLKDNNRMELIAIIEVVVGDGYEYGGVPILDKLLRIREAIPSAQVKIIFFEPVDYLTRTYLDEGRKNWYVNKYGFIEQPKSYAELEKFFSSKWKQEKRLDVEFWNEDCFDREPFSKRMRK